MKAQIGLDRSVVEHWAAARMGNAPAPRPPKLKDAAEGRGRVFSLPRPIASGLLDGVAIAYAHVLEPPVR
jgi:hypothetical protein